MTGHKELTQVKSEEPVNETKKQPFFTSLSLFFGLLAVDIAVLAVLCWRGVLNYNNLWQGNIAGVGAIFLVISVKMYLNATQRSGALFRAVLGIVMLGAGMQFLLGFTVWWVLVLLVATLLVVLVTWLLQREARRREIAQETLRESEIKYRHIVDSSNSIILEVDPAGIITFINEFGAQFFGYERPELLGQRAIATILKYGLAGASAQVAAPQVSEHPEQYVQGDKEALRKDGQKVWVNWTFTPVRDQKGNLKELLCTGLDRTDQKKSEELLVEQVKEQSAIQERSRLARDLHDAVSQTLFTSSLMAEVLPRVWKKSEEEGLKRLEDLRQLNRGALAEMRTLLYELRPASLAEVDLAELLRQLTLSVSGRSKVSVTLDADCKRQIPTDVKLALYRITQEALNNIVKHSGASHAQVTLRGEQAAVSVHVIDDGHGFDTSKSGLGSFGIGNMRERARQIGADIKIESRVDEGTEVLVEWHDRVGGNANGATEEDKNPSG